MTWWQFWRRNEMREAKEAKRKVEADRPRVERLVHELRVEDELNNFARRVRSAFRGGA